MPKGSSRNLGNNYCLAWKTGGGTHMTLAYLLNVKRGYEQERVKGLVAEFLEEDGITEHIPLITGDMATGRCVSVATPGLAASQHAIHVFLEAQGFQLRPLRPLHIDLRGQSDVVLEKSIHTRSWNW